MLGYCSALAHLGMFPSLCTISLLFLVGLDVAVPVLSQENTTRPPKKLNSDSCFRVPLIAAFIH